MTYNFPKDLLSEYCVQGWLDDGVSQIPELASYILPSPRRSTTGIELLLPFKVCNVPLKK